MRTLRALWNGTPFGPRLALACVALFCSAQVFSTPFVPRNPRFLQLGVQQGLPQDTALAMVQDHQGYLWIGTQVGLNRFDGYQVTPYRSDPADPDSLIDNYVKALYVDPRGRLWIGTRAGLLEYDPLHDRFLRQLPPDNGTDRPHGHDVRAIIGDGAGGLWLGTDEELQHLDPGDGTFKAWRHDPGRPDSLANDQIWALTRDATGNLWIGTESGVDRLTPGSQSFIHYRVDESAQPDPRRNAIRSLLIDNDGTLWVGTSEGLDAWNFSAGALKRRTYDLIDGKKMGTVHSILRDDHGNLWVGTAARGLLRWDAGLGNFISYRHYDDDPYSLADDAAESLFEDRTGTLWVGTWYGGISRFDLNSGGFERYVVRGDPGPLGGPSDGLSDNRVSSVADDGRGSIWIGTGKGLDRFDPATGKFRIYRHDPANPNSLSDDRARDVYVDPGGQLWIGTSNGLDRYDPATEHFTVRHFAAGASGDDNVFSLYRDVDGTMWIGTDSGLHHYDPARNTVESYHHDPAVADSLGEGRVMSILRDRRGRLFVATWGGLDEFDAGHGTFHHYRHDPKDGSSLINDHVEYLFEGRDGTLWVGTGGGFDRTEAGADGQLRFHGYSRRNGLVEDLVGAILQDDSGQLWISTTGGISRFDPKRESFRNYTTADGLIEGSYVVRSACRAGDGRFYFGGFHGLTAFHPEDVRGNPVPPTVTITDLRIFGRPLSRRQLPEEIHLNGPLSTSTELSLPYSDSVFTLEFAALHFADPARNRYAYRLEGFDPTWIEADATRRAATYTRLAPGHYVFHLRAANKNGVWNDTGTTLGITIRPPLWMTWWFRTLVAALLLSAMGLAYRIRIAGLKRQRRALGKEVAARTAEVVQQKTRIEEAHRNISLLSEIGRRITATLDQEAIMQTLYENVDKLMDASIFGVGLYRPQQQIIEFPFAVQSGKRYEPYLRSMSDERQLAVWCIRERRDVIVDDLSTESAHYDEQLDRSLGKLEDGSPPASARSAIYVPLMVEDRVLGILTVQSFLKQAYEPVHIDILRTLASYTAVALDNSQAYGQLQDMQQKLAQQEKMASLGRLVAGVSHEINTPLGNIRMSASVISERLREMTANLAQGSLRRSTLDVLLEAMRESAVVIERATQRADELMSSFKQLAVDQATLRARRFDVSRSLQIVIESMRYSLNVAQVEARLQSEDSLVLFGDPGRFEQIFINLVNNAISHGFEGRSGGHIDIVARRRAADIEIRFSDDGIGIPGEWLGKIFDPFFTTKFGQGSPGLGLYVVHNIVTGIFNGRIEVESVPGKGTTFTIRVPTGNNEQAQAEVPGH